MKNLDLNNYGVQEMNAEEMRVTEGGMWWMLWRAVSPGWGWGCDSQENMA